MRIYEALKMYEKGGHYPFHMPGHKGGRLGAFSELSTLDITEITGFDNLHQANGIIKEAQERCAKLFGAEESFFLVNGSTAGMEAAICSVCGSDDTVIVARNCHRSVYSALVLCGAQPVYINPEIEKSSGIAGGIQTEKLLALIKEYPQSKAVILTSPTYEGFTSDIEEIRRITASFDIALIVDEAHGAHFGFHPLFPQSAISCGADIVVQSFHKTLPSLTQTAVLHVNGNRVDRGRLKQSLSIVQTSSPSYLFLAALDDCVNCIIEEGQELFSHYADSLLAFRKSMESLQNFRLLDRSLSGNSGIFDVDLGKLCFMLPLGKMTGGQILQELRQDYGLELEMAGVSHVLAMTSIADTEEGFSSLSKAMLALDKKYHNQKSLIREKIYCPLPLIAMSPRDCFFATKKNVPIEKAKGEICGEFMIPYPPGIPFLVPGEVISEASISVILQMKQCQIAITGCFDETISQISVVKLMVK